MDEASLGHTALHVAAASGHAAVVRVLLLAPEAAQTYALDAGGRTAMAGTVAP